MLFMSRISHPVLRSLLIGFLTVQSLLLVFSQRLDTTPDPIIPEAGESLQMTLGHDSPNLGGNVFRNAYVSLTLTNAIGIEAGKLIVEISFPNQGEIEFERAELTPDPKASGAVVEVEPAQEEGDVTSVRIIVSSENPLPEGIIGNLVFKVTRELSPEELGAEGLLVTLESKTSAWTTDGQEIAQVVSGPGGIDLDYAPVVFACLFYMH